MKTPYKAAIEAAERFHEAYERLAPSFGYETRTETRTFDPSTPNGKLMIAVCAEVLAHPQTEDLDAKVQAYLLSKDLLALDEHGIPMQEDYEGNFYKQLLMGFALSLSTSKGVEALPVSEPVAWMQPNGPVISGAIYRRWSGATGSESEKWLLAKKYTIPLYARWTKE